jgi:hypothetical protein
MLLRLMIRFTSYFTMGKALISLLRKEEGSLHLGVLVGVRSVLFLKKIMPSLV